MLRRVIAKDRCRSRYMYGQGRCTRKRGHKGEHYGEWLGDGIHGHTRPKWLNNQQVQSS